MKLIVLGASLFSLATVTANAADGQKLGAQVKVNTTNTLVQTLPKIASAPDGRSVVVWQSAEQDGDDNGVYARLVAADGNFSSGELLVNQTTAGGQEDADVVVAANGNFYVAWEQDDAGGEIFFRGFSSAGTALFDQVRVDTATDATARRDPAIGYSSDGKVLITWHELQDAGPDRVKARLFDTLGIALSADIEVSAGTSTGGRDADVDASDDGTFAVVWRAVPGQDNDVYGRVLNSDGTFKTQAFQLNEVSRIVDASISDQTDPSIAGTGNGEYIAVWDSNASSYYGGVRALRFNSNGTKIAGEFRADPTQTTTALSYPVVASDSNGRFIVAWNRIGANSTHDVYAKAYTESIISRSGEILVNSNASSYDQFVPSVAVNSNGGYRIVWISTGEDGDAGGIFMQSFDGPGAFVADTADHEPDPVTIAPQSNLEPRQIVTVGPVSITGTTAPTHVSVTNGEVSIGCSGSYSTFAASTGTPNTVCIRSEARAEGGQTRTVYLNLDRISYPVVLTTRSAESSGDSGGGGGGAIDPRLLGLIVLLLAGRWAIRSRRMGDLRA